MNLYPDFHTAIKKTASYLLMNGQQVVTDKWQGKENPPVFWEALNWSFSNPIPHYAGEWEKQIKPDMTWCIPHFQERVGGIPLNPGESYKLWAPYRTNPKNDQFRTEGEKFSHTYMERFWPKYAGDWMDDSGRREYPEIARAALHAEPLLPAGIRYAYGDTKDLLELLRKDPMTRQAYLPIWFPEDTGSVHGGRVPCTLGYWFIRRNNQLHITYHIRACDYIRHFRDDIYLAVLLADWVLGELRKSDSNWQDVMLGTFTMHIGSLHIFAKEINLLKDAQF